MGHSKIEPQAPEVSENERIRSPDSIQPHGCLCVCDLQFSTVTHISQNAEEFFGRPAKDILGQPLIDVFNREFCHALRNAASLRTISKQREYLGVFEFEAGEFQAACHQRGQNFIIEFGKCDKSEELEIDINRLRWLLPRRDLEMPALVDALDILVHDLRTFTKFDRVMAYRFRPDGSGEVVSESLAANTDSYLGLRFPEWDIPKSARDICLEQPLRFIRNVKADDVPLLSSSAAAQKVDMTFSEMRSATVARKAYLSNMGVQSSLVIPIVAKGELWGMFSLQHKEPRQFTIRETLLVELLGQMITIHINDIIEKDLQDNISKFQVYVNKIMEQTAATKHPKISPDGWEYAADEICSMLELDGIVISLGEDLLEYGLSPGRDPRLFKRKLKQIKGHDIYATDVLGVNDVAGAMRVCISEGENIHLWLFRKSVSQEIKWAGAPENPVRDEEHALISPRSTFSSYVERVEGRSRAWGPSDLDAVIALQSVLYEEFANVSANVHRLPTEKPMPAKRNLGNAAAYTVNEHYIPSKKTFLILEDNHLIGIDMRGMINAMGDVNVVLVHDNETAKREIKDKDINYAFLDAKLKEETCEDTVLVLQEANINFSFITGYEDINSWLKGFSHIPIIKKPIKADVLANTVMPIISGRASDKPLSVLIVEDNLPLLERISQEVLNMGHRVERAGDVPQAERLLNSTKFDAIILDLFIDREVEPSQDGTLRIVSRIRNEVANQYLVKRDVSILAISGGIGIPGGYSPLKIALQVGVDDSMEKPLDFAKIREWLDGVRAKN